MRAMMGAALLALCSGAATAQIAVSAGDNKSRLENGVAITVRDPAPDVLTVLDLGSMPPRVLGEVRVPASVVGPPNSVAITPDGTRAIVPANQRVDPANPARTINGTTLSVVDLTARPPLVVQSLEDVPAGPAGVSVNRAGTHALVAHRGAGSVSLWRIAGGRLEHAATLEVGNAASLVSSAVFTPDGRHALVTRYGDSILTVIAIEGDTLRRAGRDISAGINPYGLVMAPDGRTAVVANIGRGGGDVDTVSVIDLTGPVNAWRVVETQSVGQTPEGIAISADGRSVAVTVMNGSNKPAGSPFLGEGQVQLWRLAAPGQSPRLRRTAVAQVGHWSQGAGFSADGRRLIVQNMVERDLSLFRIQEGRLVPAGRLPMPAAPAALAVLAR